MERQSLDSRPTSDPADILKRPRPKGDVPAERPCMSCGEPFQSDGWHNRLCQRCRKRSDAGGM